MGMTRDIIKVTTMKVTAMNETQIKTIDRGRWGWLILFTSSTTLVCCALPILLVSLGLGAVSASIFSTLPFLLTIAQYKKLIFILSAVLITIAAYLVFRSNRTCPADPELAAQCERAHRFNKSAVFISSVLWFIGFTAAYLALPIYQWLN